VECRSREERAAEGRPHRSARLLDLPLARPPPCRYGGAAQGALEEALRQVRTGVRHVLLSMACERDA
jgi:hypothetical protein